MAAINTGRYFIYHGPEKKIFEFLFLEFILLQLRNLLLEFILE